MKNNNQLDRVGVGCRITMKNNNQYILLHLHTHLLISIYNKYVIDWYVIAIRQTDKMK